MTIAIGVLVWLVAAVFFAVVLGAAIRIADIRADADFWRVPVRRASSTVHGDSGRDRYTGMVG